MELEVLWSWMDRSTLGLLLLLLAQGCDGAPTGSLDGGADAAAPADAGRSADAGDARLDAGSEAGSTDAGSPPDGGTRSDAGPPPAPGPTVDQVLAVLAAGDAAAIDAATHEVAWTGGWPLTDGERWLFVTRWPDAPEPVALVSDVVGWDPDARPATRAASGVHFYVVVPAAELRVPPAGAKYKWHGAPAVFRAPPESTAYGHDDFGPFGWVAPPADQPYLERFPDFLSPHLDAPRAFRAYLPAGFVPRSAQAASARTLFLHDGQNVFHPDATWGGWRVPEALVAYPDVVALAVDNAPDRMSAYTHVPDRISGGLVGGRADDYLRLVTEEALPFFRARYGVRAEGRSLAVGGSSLGGLVSLHFALARPTLARCVIAMSPTLGWGAFDAGAMDALLHRWSSRLDVAIYLDSGGGGTCADLDGDGIVEDSDDRDNYCVTAQMRDHLDALGYEHGVDLWHWWAPGAPHNEAAWAERVPRALESCTAGGWASP
jgi:predicted alpha/beta superfamily hydrolase